MYILSNNRVYEDARKLRKELMLVNDNVMHLIHKDAKCIEQFHVDLPDPTDPGCGAPRDLVVLAA